MSIEKKCENCARDGDTYGCGVSCVNYESFIPLEHIRLLDENENMKLQNKWICISDQKPPEQDFVLCYAPEYSSVEIRRTDLIGGAITHWMPLPQPPEVYQNADNQDCE